MKTYQEKRSTSGLFVLNAFLLTLAAGFVLTNCSPEKPSRKDYLSSDFIMHEIKTPRPDADNNTAPSMVWIDDIDGDGMNDIISSHVSWLSDYIHPYVAWYKGPDFTREFIILDKKTPGLSGNSRVYRFVMFDVDGDGKKDLIGQGYKPYHNGNKWYKHPDDPTQPWNEWYDYGKDLGNGHDIRLWDIDQNGRMDLVLMDSWNGQIIIKPVPSGDAIYSKWPSYTIVAGDGYTHYMSFNDVNKDGLEDIVICKEEDGGDGIRWYEHPGNENGLTEKWQEHFVTNANFTKCFAKDLDGDGDIDYIGSGEGYKSFDLGWLEKKTLGFLFHEIDVEDNANDVIGGHNSELVDVDGDGDEDLITGGVDKADNKQRFRWYEKKWEGNKLKWVEHILGVTSAEGWGGGGHGFNCGEMAWGDLDNDGDIDFVYAGVGSGFLGWFENKNSGGPTPPSVTAQPASTPEK